jgi:hypothetical protein
MRIYVSILLTMVITRASMAGMTDTQMPAMDHGGNDGPLPVVTMLSTFPSELTVEGVISLSHGNYVLQMGAFNRRANAEAFQHRLEKMLGVVVDLVEEVGLYKILINSELRGTAAWLFIPVSFPEPAAKKTAKSKTISVQTDTVPEHDTVPEDNVAIAAVNVAAQADTAAAANQAGEQVSYQPAPARRSMQNIFFLRGDSPWLKRYNYFGKSVALVNALIFTIIASFATMITLLVIILLNRTRMEKEARLHQYLLEQYQSLIIDYLFGNASADLFRKIASDEYRRQVLIDQMIDVSVNLKGDTGEKLVKLYKDLSLDSDSIQRAYSHRWHRKVKGFRELAFMGIKAANDEMYKAINSRNEILRMEAQIALVRLSDTEPFGFLSHLQRPFSLWEQITLHDLIIQHEIPVPEFKRWLNSPNPTVVMFALRMIREFKQQDAEGELHKVLLHRDQRVSQMAVQVAGDLNMRSTLDTMKRMYKFQEYNNCLEIVRSMGKMPELSMMGFLKLVLDKEDDVQLQIEAVKAIENMGEEGVKALVKIMKSEYKNYNIIVRHVLDRRIY